MDAGVKDDLLPQILDAAKKKEVPEELRWKLDPATAETEPDLAALSQIDAQKAISDANEYLDLELLVFTKRSEGLGDAHPSMRGEVATLERFKKVHPEMPNAVCRRLAQERRTKLEEELARLGDNGLGPKHPQSQALQQKIEPLTALIGKWDTQTPENDPDKPGASAPAAQPDRIALEDLALHLIVAIRGKDDAKLKAMASDRIKGWPEALPQFAVELREHYRQSTGDEKFDLRAGESMVEGDLGAVRCTGPAALQGKCLVLFFVRTEAGWKNHSLRSSMETVPLGGMLEDFKKQSGK